MAGEAGNGKRPTQADVARLAGVSQAVVSYVLNDNPVISISAATRQRVLDAMAELGYVPNSAARSLRTRRTATIAGIIPDITNPFYPAFERGIQDVADRHDYDLITFNTDGELEKERKAIRLAEQGRIDGLIAVFFHLRLPDLRPLLMRGIAIVRLEAEPRRAGELPLDNIFIDNTAAAAEATRYLMRQGHRRIGMIAGQSGPRLARVRGYRQALDEAGVPTDERLIVDSDFRVGGGYGAMSELLALPEPPAAIFAANDLMAIGALRAIHEQGRRVPDDIAVVGFDNIPAASVVSPPLTTVAQFPERLGQRAAEMVFERLRGRAPASGRSEAMPFELIVRESA